MTKVLVTGGSGFIGSHICEMLVSKGIETHNLDRVRKDIPGVKLHHVDLNNTDVLDQILCLNNYDTIIHMASEHEVGRSMHEPDVYYNNNVVNTINLLNLMVKHEVKNIVFSSSSSVYGNAESYPTDENTPKKPKSPYARTKSIIEDMLLDYDQAYGIKSVSLRYFNAVGSGYTQYPPTHIVPVMCNEQLSGGTFYINGTDYNTKDGTCERSYTHVTDISDAHLLAMDHLSDGGDSEVFNIGSEKTYSVLEMIGIFEEVTGQPLHQLTSNRRKGDVTITHADTSKAKEMLKWEPKYNIKEMIEDAFNWELKK